MSDRRPVRVDPRLLEQLDTHEAAHTGNAPEPRERFGVADCARVADPGQLHLDMNHAALIAQRWLAAQPAAAPGTPTLRAVHEQPAESALEDDSASWTTGRATGWALRQLSPDVVAL